MDKWHNWQNTNTWSPRKKLNGAALLVTNYFVFEERKNYKKFLFPKQFLIPIFVLFHYYFFRVCKAVAFQMNKKISKSCVFFVNKLIATNCLTFLTKFLLSSFQYKAEVT